VGWVQERPRENKNETGVEKKEGERKREMRRKRGKTLFGFRA